MANMCRSCVDRALLAPGPLDGLSITCFSPVNEVRLRDRGDPFDEHDFATRYALQAPKFRKLVHFREMSVQPEV